MNDKRFEKLLRDAAEHYNEPPSTPKEAMWKAIEARRRHAVAPKRRRRNARLWWPAAAAAVLILGFGIGRWSVEPAPVPVAQELESRASDAFFKLAAQRHLQQTETLLTLYTLDDPAGLSSERFDGRARKLLAETRLFLDSPAADDPALRALFADLELVLARIIHASSQRSPNDDENFADQLRDDPIFLRLRTQLPAGRV